MCIFEDTDPEHVREVIPLLPIICAERGAVSSLFLQYQTWHEMRTKWTCVRAFKATHAGCSFVPCEPRCTPIESPVSLVLRTQHNPYNHQSMSQWNSMNWGARPYIQTKPCYNMLPPWRLTWYKNGTSVAAALVFSAPKHRTPPVVSGARNSQGSPFRWSRWQVDGPWDHQSNSYQWGLWVYSWREANPD